MTNTIRSFIAIELPEEITETIRKTAAGFRRYKLNIRWVRPENVHLTLK
ncbi:MAG: RNA 2',3'-cyclic phosphodiesterase, partial [Proteobacteria bacterium]|nr:RNA 2',3'-cyclic phosphodiesterase [Pseudomonadota bacterium]